VSIYNDNDAVVFLFAFNLQRVSVCL